MGLRQLTSTDDLIHPLELQGQLRISDEKEFLTVDAYIKAAIAYVETFTGRALGTQSWELSFDDSFPVFPNQQDTDEIRLPLPPVTAITEVAYTDTDSQAQTLVEGTDFEVSLNKSPATIRPVDGESWPSTASIYEAVKITLTCGYGSTFQSLPANIRHAITLLVGDYYENRQTVAMIAGGPLVAPATSKAVDALLYPFRVWLV